MELRLLGSLALVGEGGPVPIGGTRARCLLGVLGVSPGRTVGVDAIAEALWGDSPPANPSNAIQQLVSKLRRVLPEPGALVFDATGYRLDLTPDEVDIGRFERLASEGRHALERNDAESATRLFDEALKFWRGPALADFAFDEWARTDIARLSELRVAVQEDRVDAELALGHHAEMASELEALVAANPLRERLRGQQMLALYATGRQADALRAFQDARRTLADELGLDPGPELRAIEARILEQDESLAIRSANTASGNLPAALTPLIGRVRELDDIVQTLAHTRVLTLVGPGGAGKTRLALEAARVMSGEVRDGAWLVELAALTDPAAVPLAIAEALAVPGASGADALASACDYLATKHVLIVLDNCEHLVAAAAAAALTLAERCPGLRILATSREGLGIAGERLWPVPPLRDEDAAALFVERMNAVTGADTLEPDDESTIAEICTRLDGLPLAIELAAARVRALPVTEVAKRLDDRFRLLTGGARTALPRHRTLQAVVDWSFEMLFDDERRLFERLSVFAGGFALEAVEAVCADDDVPAGDVTDLVLHLVDKSLVVAIPDRSRARFSLLQTLADYGRERLQESGDATRFRERHAAYYASRCDSSEAAYSGERQIEWLEDTRRELENLRAAFEYSLDTDDAQRAHHIASGVGWVWWVGGYPVEGLRWMERALACDGEVGVRTRGRARVWYAWLLFMCGKPVPEALVAETIEAFTNTMEARLCDVYFTFGEISYLTGRPDEARRHFERAHELLLATGEERESNVSWHFTNMRLALLDGNVQVTEEACRAAVDAAIRAGDHFGTVQACSLLADITDARGAFEESRAAITRARTETQIAGLRGADTVMLARLGILATLLGNFEEAESLHREALIRANEEGSPTQRAHTLNSIATRCRHQGQLDEAQASAEEALEVLASATGSPGWIDAVSICGFLAETRGDADAADAWHRRILDDPDAKSNPAAIALALEGLAGVAVLRGEANGAARLLGAASTRRARAAANLFGTARSDIERIERAARNALGDEAYDGEFTSGAESSLDALVG